MNGEGCGPSTAGGSPTALDRLLGSASLLGQRQRAQYLREVRVGRGADQQSARLSAWLVRDRSEPGPGAAAVAERLEAEVGRLVQSAAAPALAPHAQVGEIAAGAALEQPQLAVAGVAVLVNVAAPVEILDMAARAGADESGRNDLLAVEPAFLVKRVAVHQSAGPIAGVAGLAVFLDHHPFAGTGRRRSRVAARRALRCRAEASIAGGFGTAVSSGACG